MVCHGELATLKPHPDHLTSFYLSLSVGGAIGGILTVFIAPHFFNGDYELPMAMAALAVFSLVILNKDKTASTGSAAGKMRSVGVIITTVVVVLLLSGLSYRTIHQFVATRLSVRNFFATLTVNDHGVGEQALRTLSHGAIIHGAQFLADDRRAWPTTYYGEHSGVAMAILANRTAQPQRVGVIGLGAGTLAVYGRSGDDYRFYEINPLVIDIARSQFRFLDESRARISVVLGDARPTLARESLEPFDVLVVDAFSGDAIPVHLLTREAFGIYFQHLKPGGVLAVHVTNHYLDLPPVVKLAADYYGKHAWIVDSQSSWKDSHTAEFASIWVLVSDRPEQFTRAPFKGQATPLAAMKARKPWTDDYSSIYSVLKAIDH